MPLEGKGGGKLGPVAVLCMRLVLDTKIISHVQVSSLTALGMLTSTDELTSLARVTGEPLHALALPGFAVAVPAI
jgi:hypothetical protein